MNEEDHALFARLIDAGGSSQARLMEIAALAARDKDMALGGLEGDEARALRLLSPALEGDGSRCHFRDSLAPQFLLAMLLTSGSDQDSAVRPYTADVRE